MARVARQDETSKTYLVQPAPLVIARGENRWATEGDDAKVRGEGEGEEEVEEEDVEEEFRRRG